MKQIPRVVLIDYLCYSVGFFLFIVLLEPFGTRDFIKTNVNPYSYYVVEAISFFLILLLCELFTTFLCHLPADFSQSREYQAKRLLCHPLHLDQHGVRRRVLRHHPLGLGALGLSVA